ncbi:DUF6056 family protein [Streptomyces sp. NPDC088757]|uniref:DUF6056 family protein n=1 Tax=Streptomyces sp. NPDC088757 TaxID=3365889 RepID=UPI00381A9F82
MSRTAMSEPDEVSVPEDGAKDGAAGEDGTSRTAGGIALVVAAGAAALLSVGAFLGLYVRPTSDDWCALWKARDMGVLGITSDFYLTQNGRVTNAFLTGLLYSDGMTGPGLLPAFLVVALGAGLFLLAREALRALRLTVPVVTLVAAVALLEALLFFAGTRPYQALLWAPATLSHTVPSVLGVWTVLTAVWAARSRRRRARAVAVGSAVLLGAAAGTLCEPFVATAAPAAAVLAVLCLPRLGWTRDRYATTWCSAWCLGLVTGLVLLWTSPGARWRRSQQPEVPLSVDTVRATVRDWTHIWGEILGQWAYAGALAAGLLLGLTATLTTDGRTPGPRAGGGAPRWLFPLLAVAPIPLVALASLAAAYGLRSGYGTSGWTYARTWTSFLVPFLLALCGYGALLGRALGRVPGRPSAPAPSPPRRRVRPRYAALAAAGVLAAASVTALVPAVRATTTQTVSRSVAWDLQDARIRARAAGGATEVTYRPLHIGHLAEPFFTRVPARDWAARCAARYYGVDRIRRP